jgi:hypothetical protein
MSAIDVHIQLDKKFSKFDAKIQGYSLLSAISMAVYGKTIADCLEVKQVISVKRTKNKNFIIHMLPEDILKERHMSMPCSTGEYIRNIISHCLKNGVKITTV